MAITPVVRDQWHDGKRTHVVGALTFTGNYTTGGVAVDFPANGVQTAAPPTMVDVPAVQGHSFVYVPGTSASNGLLQVWKTSDGTQLAAAAFPAALLGAQAAFYGIFKAGL